MAHYALFLKGNHSNWKNHSPEEIQKIMGLYMDWVKKLRDANQFVSGASLGRDLRVLRGDVNGIHVDGPFAETKETITGTFVIKAVSIEEAVEIARGCPAFLHGETVEVHPMEE